MLILNTDIKVYFREFPPLAVAAKELGSIKVNLFAPVWTYDPLFKIFPLISLI